ncbi:MAG: hypothetical protein D6816_10580 [Bacteroidetes bacterium]|nr:MAG: hypothetical protein D6816_10580 [Bacteroidota bacterium]
MLCAMKLLAFIAFAALQLSMLACSADAHVHHMDGSSSSIEHHHDPIDGDNNPIDYPCEIHAAHTFIAFESVVSIHSQSVFEGAFPTEKMPIVDALFSLDRPPIA